MYSVSITHNSKIRELSDRNRVMETKLSFAKQPFCYGFHHFWVMSYENRELSYQKRQFKRPLNFRHSSLITCLTPQFPSLNIFHTICGPIHVSRCNFFFFFLSFGEFGYWKKKKSTVPANKYGPANSVKNIEWWKLGDGTKQVWKIEW